MGVRLISEDVNNCYVDSSLENVSFGRGESNNFDVYSLVKGAISDGKNDLSPCFRAIEVGFNKGVWFELRRDAGGYRIVDYTGGLTKLNGCEIHMLGDGMLLQEGSKITIAESSRKPLEFVVQYD